MHDLFKDTISLQLSLLLVIRMISRVFGFNRINQLMIVDQKNFLVAQGNKSLGYREFTGAWETIDPDQGRSGHSCYGSLTSLC